MLHTQYELDQLLIHEIVRVFNDRLVDLRDQREFVGMVADQVKAHLAYTMEEAEILSLNYCRFVSEFMQY